MINNKIQFLLIFIITASSSNAFGIDYFSLSGIKFKGGVRQGGVVVGEVSEEKLKKFFYKKMTIIFVKKEGRTFERKTQTVSLTDRIYSFDEIVGIDEVQLGVSLTRSLAIDADYKKQSYEVVAIPVKYKVEDIKMLNLRREEGDNDLYLKAMEKDGRQSLPAKAVSDVLSRRKYFSIFKDSDYPRFAISGSVLFFDKKPIFYNYYGFSPIINHDEVKSFLLKINGKMFFLGRFPLAVQEKGYMKKFESYYYLVSLEDGKVYLPVHLRGKQ
ncbi:MAG: hypothetical protein CME66_13855 [Halobacteriovoraceae bacterium]|jgi:hypothetical protein|nr:hypothetical protein [Halobacteriovoraceae bacterium]